MKFLLTKASSDYWYDFIEEASIEKLLGRFSSCGQLIDDLIIKENPFYRAYSYRICEAWDFRISLEQAFEISRCRYEIKIYDDFIE